MKPVFEELQIVALRHDIPEHGLRSGETGTVVMVYDQANVEVEFVEDTGYTRALLTLSDADVTPLPPESRRPRRPKRTASR